MKWFKGWPVSNKKIRAVQKSGNSPAVHKHAGEAS